MKSSEFRYLAFIFILFLLILLAICCKNQVEKSTQTEIDRIAARWVPDQRIAIYRITAKTGKEGKVILSGETTIPEAKKDIIEALNHKSIRLIDSILILPDTITNKKFMGLVSISVINLRRQTDHASELVSQAILGTPVMILKNGNSWLLIQTPDKYIAWTEKSSVKLMNKTEMESWKHSDRLIFMENSGWVYSSPDESGVVGDLVAGSILKKTGESGSYAKVSFPDGREGFVKNAKLMHFNDWTTQVQCTGENVCRIASTFLGLPYLWGGTSSKGVDCSGFVQSVYFMNGIILSRDASLQALHGFDVDISDGFSRLKKGDLLLFGSKDNSQVHVTHVAIFIGDGEYINSSGRVMIDSLDFSHPNIINHKKTPLLFAKRVIGSKNDLGIVPVSEHGWY